MNSQQAVVGAGVVGLTMSLMLAKNQHTLSLFDNHDISPKILTDYPTSRVIALNEGSISLFKSLDVWPDIEKNRFCAYGSMHVWDANSGGELAFNASEVLAQSLGIIIEEQVLKNALIEKLKTFKAVSFYPKSQIQAISHQQHGLSLQVDGKIHDFNALFAADGANSFIRKALGISQKRAAYGQKSIVCTVFHQHSHNHSAKQVFTPHGPLAFLPLFNENLSSIVWSLDDEKFNEINQLDDTSFIDALNDAFLQKLMVSEIKGKRMHFPLIRRQAIDYYQKKVVLLGDAACGIHPLAGQGMNLGLKEVALLQSLYQKNKANFFSEETFLNYQRQSQAHNQKMLWSMDFLKSFFSKNNHLPKVMRKAGMRLVGGGLAKRFLINLARGKAAFGAF